MLIEQPGTRTDRSRRKDAQHLKKTMARNVLNRVWRPYLTVAERDLLTFVMDSTLEWGNDTLDFTWEQLRDGQKGSGDWPYYRPPIGMGRTSFYKLLGTLETRGVIKRRAQHRTRTEIAINLDWRPEPEVPSITDMIRAKEGNSHSQGAGSNKVLCSEPELIASAIRTPLQQKKIQPQRKNDIRPTGEVAPSPIREVNKEAKPRGQTRPGTVPNPLWLDDSALGYRNTFRRTWGEAYEGIPVPDLAEKEGHVLRATLVARWPQNVSARHEFLEFVTRNWRQIVANHFRWMSNPPPAMPKIGFICSHKIFPVFLDAYASRAQIEYIKLLPAEEAEVARLIANGLSREEALTKAGERRALSKIKTSDLAVRRDNAMMMSRIEQERRNLTEERKQILRDRAAQAKPPRAQPESFAKELGNLPSIPKIDLPDFDPAAWD